MKKKKKYELKNTSGLVNTYSPGMIFNMFRLAGHTDILANSSVGCKEAYYGLFVYLTRSLQEVFGFGEYLKNLQNTLNLIGPIRQTDPKILIKNSIGHAYIFPLILESGFLLSFKNDFDMSSWLNKTCIDFRLKPNEVEWYKKFFLIVKNRNIDKLNMHYDSSKNLDILKDNVKHTFSTIFNILKYNQMTQKHIAIISTMSSGKSTFINALIGDEIFPETQSACTAKITSIYDNDAMDRISGIAFYGNEIKQAKITINKDVAKNWNDNKDIDKIVFEGNLKNIFNHNQVVAIHDTPGTNFSSDEEHKKITINFLNNTKLDAIICLINAMYLGTNDSLEILRQIREISEDRDNEILFVLNKIDAMDNKKENSKDTIKKAKVFIESVGFREPALIATSAKAVKLFKMALDGMSSKFSEDEEDDFGIFLRKFLQGKPNHKANIKVKVGIKEYYKEDIIYALKNTNFHIIEKIINKGE